MANGAHGLPFHPLSVDPRLIGAVWFVYCNARRDLAAFDAHPEFKIKLIVYDGDDGWVEGTLATIHETLRASEPPAVNEDCEYCHFAARSEGP